MNPIRVGYLLLFGLSAVGCFIGAWRTTNIVDDDIKTGLVALLVLSGTWAGASVGRLLTLDPAVQTTFYLIGLVSGLATVGAWLYFCSAYTGSEYHRRSTIRVGAVTVFLIVVSVKLTNPLHQQYFVATIQTTPFRHVSVEYQTIHWVVTGLAYALATIGFYLLYELFDQSHYDTTTLGALVAITGVPAVFDILAFTEVAPSILLKFNYEPIGVALFAIGALYLADETLVAVPRLWQQDLLDDLDEAIIVLDRNGIIRDYNDPAATLFPAVIDATGDPFEAGIPVLAESLAADEEILELDRDDEVAFYRLRSVSLSTGSGSDRGCVVVCADVTEVERQRRQLQRQTEQFDDFAEATTHELRNAVTMVDGYLDLVADRVADERDATNEHPIDWAAEGVDRMRTVIADLTALVRYSQPVETVQPVTVRTAVREGFSEASADDLEYEVKADCAVQADEQRLTELFADVFRFAAANGASRVTVDTEDDTLLVTTDGSPLSPRAQDKALAYGEPVPSADTGMTLPNVQMVARGLAWTVTFDESYTDGVRLRLEGVTAT